jgi:hypothetical protein
MSIAALVRACRDDVACQFQFFPHTHNVRRESGKCIGSHRANTQMNEHPWKRCLLTHTLPNPPSGHAQTITAHVRVCGVATTSDQSVQRHSIPQCICTHTLTGAPLF